MELSDLIIKPSKYLPSKLVNTHLWREAALHFKQQIYLEAWILHLLNRKYPATPGLNGLGQ